MQQINTEQQRASARLLQQLPANKINETTTNFTHSQHVNKNSKPSARRLQTDLADFDTSRSLSTVPTYSSLSRHSPETRVSRRMPVCISNYKLSEVLGILDRYILIKSTYF